MRFTFFALCAVFLLAICAVAYAGWVGNTYYGTDASEHAIGNSADNIMWGAGGNDWLEGRDGDDQLRGGRGTDTLNGNGGSDILWACGQSDDCGGSPGHDYMHPDSGGGQINAGQYPAVGQHLYCAGGFNLVYYDDNDNFEGTKSQCEDLRKVGPASATSATG